MNTDKTLNEKFIEKKDCPIWYYKELKEVDIDYVIWNLLKETFVVEINGSKHEITFGKNRKGEIGQYIRYDDIKSSNLNSYKVVEKGFREGKWFIITDIDTSNEFKSNYMKEKFNIREKKTEQWYKKILNNAIEDDKEISIEQKK